MARRKSKFRFGVIAGGVERELFSVRDRSTGELAIIIRSSRRIQYGGKDVQLINERISVHSSPNSDPPGRLVKVTLTLEDDRELTTAQFRRNIGNGFATIAYAAQCGDLARDQFTMPQNPRDVKHILHPVDVGKCTLFYFVIVSDYEIDQKVLESMNLSFETFKFSSIWLTVATGFFALPPIHIASIQTLITSSPSVNGTKPRKMPEIAVSLTPESIAQTCIWQIGQMTKYLMANLKPFLASVESAELQSALSTQLRGYYKTPVP